MRTPVVLAVTSALAFGAGVFAGILLAAGPGVMRATPPRAEAGAGRGGTGGDGAATPMRTGGATSGSDPDAGGAGAAGVPGGGAGGAAARPVAVRGAGVGADPAAPAGRAPSEGGPDEGPPRGAGGTVRPGTGSGRPAKTDAGGPALASTPLAARAAPGRTGALPDYTLPETLTGRLVDAVTGEAIPEAEVTLRWETGDGTMSSGVRADLRPDGSFSLKARERIAESLQSGLGPGGWLREKYAAVEAAMADLEFRLAGSAPGYAALEKGDPDGHVELRLVHEVRAPLPGSVRVDARRLDGSAFPGRLLVDFLGDARGRFSQWATPESDGTFLLPGVPAGTWNVRAAGKHDSGVEIRVPEAGEAHVMLRVPRAGLVEHPMTPAGEPREVEVAVAGRDAGAGAFLRAEAHPGVFFRAEVVGGTAGFAALPAGRWTFVLERPGKPDEAFTVDVPEGAGRLALALPPPGATSIAK